MKTFSKIINMSHRVNRKIESSAQLYFIPTSMGDAARSFKRVVIPDEMRESINNHVSALRKKYSANKYNLDKDVCRSNSEVASQLPDWELYYEKIQQLEGYEQKYFPGISKDLLLLNKSYGKMTFINARGFEGKALFKDNSYGIILYPFPIILREFLYETLFLFPEILDELLSLYRIFVYNASNNISEISFSNFLDSKEVNKFHHVWVFNKTIKLYKSSVFFNFKNQIDLLEKILNKHFKSLRQLCWEKEDTNFSLQSQERNARTQIFLEGCITAYSRQKTLYTRLCLSNRKLADIFQIGVPVSDLNYRGILEYCKEGRDMNSHQSPFFDHKRSQSYLNSLVYKENISSKMGGQSILEVLRMESLHGFLPRNVLYSTNQPKSRTRRNTFTKKDPIPNLYSKTVIKETTIFTYYLNDVLKLCSNLYDLFGLASQDFVTVEIQRHKLQNFIQEFSLNHESNLLEQLPRLQKELSLSEMMYQKMVQLVSIKGLNGIDSNILLYHFYDSVEYRLSQNWVPQSDIVQLERDLSSSLQSGLECFLQNRPLTIKLIQAKISLLSFLKDFGLRGHFFLAGEKDQYLFPLRINSIQDVNESITYKKYFQEPTKFPYKFPWSQLQNNDMIQSILSEWKSHDCDSEIHLLSQNFGIEISPLSSQNEYAISFKNPFERKYLNLYQLCDMLMHCKHDILLDQINFISKLYNFYNLIGLPHNVWLDNQEDSFSINISNTSHITSVYNNNIKELASLFPEHTSVIESIEKSLQEARYSLTSLCLINKEESYSGAMFSYICIWISNLVYFLISNQYSGIPNKIQKPYISRLISYIEFITYNCQKSYLEWRREYFTSEWQKLSSEYWLSFSGKTGRFRGTVLSKRSNFTGRAVITSGPELSLSQCVIPCRVALPLFLPLFVAKVRPYFNKMFELIRLENSTTRFLDIFSNHSFAIVNSLKQKPLGIKDHILFLNYIVNIGIQILFYLKHSTKSNWSSPIEKSDLNLFVEYVMKDPFLTKYLSIQSVSHFKSCILESDKEALKYYMKLRFCDYIREHLWIACHYYEHYVESSSDSFINSLEYGLFASLHYFSGFITYFNKLMGKYSVLLIRQPALHRMSLQSFVCRLGHEVRTIRLNTLVCPPFNADFDGDTMSVFLPQSVDSQIEANTILSSFNNIISPSTSNVIIAPTLDTLFGLYYLTSSVDLYKEVEPIHMTSVKDFSFFEQDFYLGMYPVSYPVIFENVVTTIGRISIYHLICHKCSINFDLLNNTIKKKTLSALISEIITQQGYVVASFILDLLNTLGREWSYKSGLTVNYLDFIVPDIKNKISKKLVSENASNQYMVDCFFMTKKQHEHLSESYKTKMVEKVIENLKDDISYIPLEGNSDRLGVYMLIDSGSRGSINQLKQICGVKGFVKGATGEIVPKPIMGNLKEGFSQEEFFLSSIGGRKGMIDRSLNTQVTGYLHRLLNSSMKTLTIAAHDCMTFQGIPYGLIDNEFQNEPFYISASRFDHLVGRVLAANIYDPITGNQLLYRNEILTKKSISLLLERNISDVLVRSPLTCGLDRGVCQRCYGADSRITHNSLSLVKLGYPVGIIAAQAMGEPSTQLSMRTFHQGGIVDTIAEEQLSMNVNYSSNAGFVYIYQGNISSKNYLSSHPFTSHSTYMYYQAIVLIIGSSGEVKEGIPIPQGAFIYIQDGDYVVGNTIIYEMPFLSPKAFPICLLSPFPIVVTNISYSLQKATWPIRGVIEYISYGRNTQNKMSIIKDFVTFFENDVLCVRPGDYVSQGSPILYGQKNEVDTSSPVESYRIIKRILDAPKSTYGLPIAYFDGYVSILPLDLEHITISLVSEEIALNVKILLEWIVPLKILGIEISCDDFDFNSFNLDQSENCLDVDQDIRITLKKQYTVPKNEVGLLKIRDGNFVEEGFIMRDLKDCVYLREIVFFWGIDGAWKMIGKNILEIYRSAGITFEPVYMELLVKQMLQLHTTFDPLSYQQALESRHQILLKFIHQLCYTKEFISIPRYAKSSHEKNIPNKFLPYLYYSFQTLLSIRQIPFVDLSFFSKISFERMASSFLQAFKQRDHFQDQRSVYDIDTNLFMTISPAYGTTLKKRMKKFNQEFIRRS